MLSDKQTATSSTGLLSPAFLLSIGLVFLLIGGLAGQLRLWTDDGVILAAAFRYVALIALPIIVYAYMWSRRSGRPLALDPGGFAFGLVLIFFSGWLDNDFALLHGAAIRGELILLSLLPALLWPRARSALIYCVAFITPVLLIWCFAQVAAGRLIFSDDHAVMIYRLTLLKQNFPSIPHYNPLWNAGIDARDFFATGILNVYLFFYPLIRFFSVYQIYNIIVALTAFALLPLSTYSATRLLGQNSKAAAIASLLALSSNLLWYRWVLKYGAMGFVFSACMLPLVVALFYRFTFRTDAASRRETALFIAASCLMLLWSPTALFLAPLAVFLLLRAKKVFARRDAWITCALVAALTLPWVAVFISVSGVSSFVSTAAVSSQVELKEPREASITRALKGGKALLGVTSLVGAIREAASKANPLLIVFCLPGLAILSKRSAALMLSALVLWLLLLGTVGNALKPQLELDRAFVVLGLLLTIPSAVAIETFLRAPRVRFLQYVMPSIVCGYLFSGIFATSNIIYNRSAENYSFTEEIFAQLPAAISQYGGEGRSVFPGFILHEFNAAHVAPVALMTGHPMVASSPFHNLWWYTELVPGEFLERGEDGIEEYFDLMNASSVIVHEPRWRNYFTSRPDRYTLKWRFVNFSLFSRKQQNATYFLEGQGRILNQDSRSVSLIVESSRVVVKFNYFPFLRSSSCTLQPFPIAGTKLMFIELGNCTPGETVTIKSDAAWRRVLR